MINPVPHLPSAILIGAGGRLRPLAPWPPCRDPLVPAALPLGTPGRASQWRVAAVQRGAGVGTVSALPVAPLLAALMPQGSILGRNHRIPAWQGSEGTSVGHPVQPPAEAGSNPLKGGGETKAAYFSAFPRDALAIRHPQRCERWLWGSKWWWWGERAPRSTLCLALRWSWLGSAPSKPGGCRSPCPSAPGLGPELEGGVVALQKGVGYLWGLSPLPKGGSSLFAPGEDEICFLSPLCNPCCRVGFGSGAGSRPTPWLWPWGLARQRCLLALASPVPPLVLLVEAPGGAEPTHGWKHLHPCCPAKGRGVSHPSLDPGAMPPHHRGGGSQGWPWGWPLSDVTSLP